MDLSIRQAEQLVASDSLNFVAWKVLLDSSEQHDQGRSFIKVFRKMDGLNLRKPDIFTRWRGICSYLEEIASSHQMPSYNGDTEDWNFLKRLAGKSWVEAKQYRDVLFQVATSHEGDLDENRKYSKIYYERYPGDYFIHHWYANSFRTGRLSGLMPINREKFRAESLEMTKRYPERATPHYTVAMTTKDSNLGLSEARKYLKLERRPIKASWVKRIKERYPILK